MAHPNEELTRRAYAAFGNGDMQTLGELIADDATWYVPGDNPIAGEYHGKDEIFAFFGRVVEETGGTFGFEMHDVLANDDHAVALVKASGERGGKTVDGEPQVHVVHIEDGQVVSFWNHPYDAEAFNDFWS